MTQFPTKADGGAATLSRRLADRGPDSGLLAPDAAASIHLRCDPSPDLMRAVLEEAFALAIAEGVLRVTADHVANALAMHAPVVAAPGPEIAHQAPEHEALQHEASHDEPQHGEPPVEAPPVAMEGADAWLEAPVHETASWEPAPYRPVEHESHPHGFDATEFHAPGQIPAEHAEPEPEAWEDGAHQGHALAEAADAPPAEPAARLSATFEWLASSPQPPGSSRLSPARRMSFIRSIPPAMVVEPNEVAPLDIGASPRLAPPEAVMSFRPRLTHMMAAVAVALVVGVTPVLLRGRVFGGPSAEPGDAVIAPVAARAPSLAIPTAPSGPPTVAVVAVEPPAPEAAPVRSVPSAVREAQVVPALDALSSASQPATATATASDPPPAPGSPPAEAAAPPEAQLAAIPAVFARPQPALPAAALPHAGLPQGVEPRVIVEYAGADPDQEVKASQLADSLRSGGLTVVGIAAASARRPAGVHYAFAEDRAGAESVASRLGSPWQARALPFKPGEGDLPEPGLVRLSLP